MPNRRVLTAVLGACSLLTVSTAFAQSLDPGVYYRLSTQFRGTDMPLDVFNGGTRNNQARLDRSQNVTGQFWRFVPAGDGSYRLQSQFRGPSMCLDINPPTNRPELRACGDFSGQSWQIVPEGEWVRLTTSFRGRGMCLDVDPDSNQPELRRCGDFSGQLWRLSRTSTAVR